jgi:3D (Asp-Asp-Asp) domain-containing protein
MAYMDCPKPPSAYVMTVAYKGPEEYYKPSYYVDAVLTAYTSSLADCGKTDGVSASGVTVDRGMVAAPKSIPFFTILDIDGERFTVVDRGSAIIQVADVYHIDIWLPTKKEVDAFGRQVKKIRIFGRR